MSLVGVIKQGERIRVAEIDALVFEECCRDAVKVVVVV